MNIKTATEYLAGKDEIMSRIIQRAGILKLPVPRSNFESLADAIVSQQLSVKAAATIYKRFSQLLNHDISPGNILSTPPEAFRAVGLSGQKAKYMGALAEAFIQNGEEYSRLHEFPNEEVLKLLTDIKGIGVWTAQMFMMFNLLREDIFPVGDLGIRKAVERHYFEGEKQGFDLLLSHAEIWKPYRTVASFYLWRSLDIKD